MYNLRQFIFAAPKIASTTAVLIFAVVVGATVAC